MPSSELIDLCSPSGSVLLHDVQSSSCCGSCYQHYIHGIFTKQVGGTSCGLVTCALVLSANRLGLSADLCAGAAAMTPAFTEQNMFSYPETRSVITEDSMVKNGMSLDDVHNLLVAHGCKSVRCVQASDVNSDQLRSDCVDALSHSDSSRAIVINYHMQTLGQGADFNFGHHSPLAAYHPPTDRLLILDTWPSTRECWATVENVHAAMDTIDAETGKTRGYCVVEF